MFTPYMATVSPDAVELKRRVEQAMQKIPDMKLPSGKLLSCHIVCRILSKLLKIPYKDGHLKYNCEHSWLVTDRYIIDPYPIGILNGPLIIDNMHMLLWPKMYIEDSLDRVKTTEFKKDLAYAMQQIRWHHVWSFRGISYGIKRNYPIFKCLKCGQTHLGLFSWMRVPDDTHYRRIRALTKIPAP